MNVLFVCNGNCSRSAMAEAYFTHLCQQNKLTDVNASSAGLAVKEEAAVGEEVTSLISALGLSLEGHTPRQLTVEIASESNHIICMSQEQADAIHKDYLTENDNTKVHLLLDFNGGGDLANPEKGQPDTYEQCFLSMMPALAELADRFIRSVQ